MTSREKPDRPTADRQRSEASHRSGSHGDHTNISEKKSSKQKDTAQDSKSKKPAGGHDSTPFPNAPPGYTVKITFHRAKNLPMADMNSFSSDPYILAQINTALQPRHREDPPLRIRTHTVRRSTDPVWNAEWIVANIPPSGFTLKARIYDEDPADHDDRLGNVHVRVDHVDENWAGIKNEMYQVKKRMGSKRAYLIRTVAACFRGVKHINGHLYISVEVLGRTEDEIGGRVYTAGPNWWTRHYSPLLGRLANRKEPGEDEHGQKTKAERYNFQANQMQLRGPVPAELYHRYVEFKPFVRSMFTKTGIRGFILSKALHHQHARVYNFDRMTKWGIFSSPCRAMTQQFLDLVHHDQGGRIFTYVLTLDALFRFTETGKEFGIDMLSKHTMHSDVGIYIAFSGEFFLRRLKHPHRAAPQEEEKEGHDDEGRVDDGAGDAHKQTHPPADISGGPPDEDPPRDPSYYELIVDNDSGTYRPSAALLPQLRRFLEASLPGLRVVTLDCQADAEHMARMKAEQRERKDREGDNIVFTQGSRSSSVSSSDEEALDRLAAGGAEGERERGLLERLGREAGARKDAEVRHWKGVVGGRDGEEAEEGVGVGGSRGGGGGGGGGDV